MKILICGLQYGDEGKGRVSSTYGGDADWFVRFNGGPNAGHTSWHKGSAYKLHHLPAGAPAGKKIALDAGMVINPFELLDEIRSNNIDPSNIYVNRAAHVILPKHIAKDSKGSGIGSTKKGIAYTYADRVLRNGVRAGLLESIVDSDEVKQFTLYQGLPPIKPEEKAIFESSQGLMIDVDYGWYPFVTSSSVLPHAGHKIDKVIGVMKAYTSRVGDGPPNFPSEPELSERGKEIGTTTGRVRRCCWLILDEIKYALSVINPDEVIITKIDVLSNSEIYLYEGYKKVSFSSLHEFLQYLKTQIPNLKYCSDMPFGPLKEV